MSNVYTWLPIEVPEVEINSLAEFITTVSKLDADKYYFRGESQYYISRTASVYRRILTKEKKPAGFTNNFVSFNDLISEYYIQVGSLIDSAEKENFIAYSQHHGLWTPLLDVTMNGLVALYFATESDFDSPGYVYLFDKFNSIDISNFLRGTDWNDILTKIIQFKDPDFVSTITNGLLAILKNDEIEFFTYVYSLGQHINHLLEKGYPGILDDEYVDASQKFVELDFPESASEYSLTDLYEDVYYRYCLDNFTQHESMKEKFSIFLQFIEGNYQSFFPYKNCDFNLYIVAQYLFVLRIHLTQLSKEDVGAYEFHNLPSFPMLTYKPTYLFDRMKAQDGIFFYQLGLHKTESVYDSGSIETQNFLPKMVLKINNKVNILNDLNSFGVSKKNLFPDVDNIASYLNNQFSRFKN